MFQLTLDETSDICLKLAASVENYLKWSACEQVSRFRTDFRI